MGGLTDARIIRPLGMTRSGAHPETLYLDDNYYTGHGGAPGISTQYRTNWQGLPLPVRLSRPDGT